MSERKPAIKYTNREFETIKQGLTEYAKKHHPNIFKDDSPNNFGSMVIDTVAYIGDQLSLLTDFNYNESFLDSSIMPDNILRHGRSRGWKHNASPSTYGTAQFYINVPVDSTGTKPDTDFMGVLKRGSEFASTKGTAFLLNEDVDFANPNNEIVVSQINDATGAPLYFAVKAEGQIVSGEVRRQIVRVGPFVPFFQVRLTNPNITQIISVTDAEGHRYYETSHLSQDVIYRPVVNRDATTSEQVINILKPFPVPRRFVVEQENRRTMLTFGYGTELGLDETSPVDPSNVVFQMNGREFITDESFDPQKMIESDKFGIGPSNTTLTVVFRSNTNVNANATPGSVTRVVRPIFDFKDQASLDANKISTVVQSLEIDNEKSIQGDVSFPTSRELKERIKDHWPTQNRAVTKRDYVSMAYAMPARFGKVKRASIVQDKNSFKRNLNMYVVSENGLGQLETSNLALKNNLKVWLNRFKMINDTLSIIDANIVNLGVDFTVVSEPGRNKAAVLTNCVIALRKKLIAKQDIGEPFQISQIYKTLNAVDGVTDTVDVRVARKSGGLYSDSRFNVRQNLSADGRLLFAPEDVIFEVKYLDADLKGIVR